MRINQLRVFTLAALYLFANVFGWPLSTCAEFSDNQYPQQPDILPKLIAVAQASGKPFASAVHENTTYYLRRAEYIGSCEAPFGRVHAAQFFYIRSAPKGSKLPARGHAFILFFDSSLRLRGYWCLDMPLSALTFDGTKFRLGSEELFDFSNPPKSEHTSIDGTLQSVPIWKPTK